MEKLIALLLVGLLSHAAESDRQCDRSNTDPCNEAAVTVILGSQNQFPGEAILNAYCSNFNTTINCIVDEARECSNSRNKEVLNEYMEIQRIIHNICHEGSTFRRRYLESVPCLNRNLDKLRNCSSSIQAEVTSFRLSEVNTNKNMEVFTPFKYECMKMSLVPNCRIRVAVESCGLMAARNLADIEFAVSDLMLNTLCGKVQMAIWLDQFLSYVLSSRQSSTSSTEETETSQATTIEVPSDDDVIVESISETLANPESRYAISSLVRASKKKSARGDSEEQQL